MAKKRVELVDTSRLLEAGVELTKAWDATDSHVVDAAVLFGIQRVVKETKSLTGAGGNNDGNGKSTQ